jgi:hypothetical protein
MDKGNRCIVNVSTGGFIRGQNRLVASLLRHGYDGGFMLWGDELPAGCPSHRDVPYAFKTYALNEAKTAGYDVLFWLDASMWAVKNIEPAMRHIEEHGHLFEVAGQWLGWYSTDAFLEKHGLTRDEAMTIPTFSAGFTGLDLRHPQSLEFLDKWHEMAKDGVSFCGAWNNDNNACSIDPRCKGHRHDMSAGSLLAHRMGMELIGPRFMVYDAYTPCPGQDVIFLCRGC